MIRATIEPDGRVQIPPYLMRDWPSRDLVELVPTDEGILLRPTRRLTWDEVFQHKATPGEAEPRDLPEEITGDDLFL